MKSTTGLRRSDRLSGSSKPSSEPSSKPYDRPSQRSRGKPRRKPAGPSKKTMNAPPQTLYLRINQRFSNIIPQATATQPNPQPIPPIPGTTGNLNVIIANLPELHPFSGDNVDWLIKIARLIFEPLGTSTLYTFVSQSVDYWLEREMDPPQWRPVQPGEPLMATIYEFRPNHNALVTPTRISLRQARSVTTNTSVARAGPFRDELLRRDTRCIVSGEWVRLMLVASHLLPRRLGDVGVRSVMQRFTGSNTPVDRYDSRLGVLLFSTMDLVVDTYCLGFWNTEENQYVLHNYFDQTLSIRGSATPTAADPTVHGYQITLTSHEPGLSLPPAGVFNWHYIQCVLKKFASPDYRGLQNIFSFNCPFRTRDDEDDSDRDFDDERNVENPPYPSYHWDLAQWRQSEHLEAEERKHTIMAWSSGVSA